MENLLTHHDGLRQRLLLSGERTRIRIAPRGDVTPFEVFDLSDLDEAEQERRLPELFAGVQISLDLAVGPLVRVALVKLGDNRPCRLAVIVHRLAADVVSLRILVEDLATASTQLSAGQPVRLPAKTTSWQSWVRRLVAYAGTEPVQSQRGYWTDLVTAPAGELPFDKPAEPTTNTAATARTVTASLNTGTTDELLRACDALNCRTDELLLSALGRTLSGWSGVSRHLVDLVRHDRDQIFEDVDVSRTVGPFSRTYPVALTCDPDGSPEATLRTVKEAVRSAPSAGIGWPLLRQDADPVPDAPVEVAFSYLGQLDRPASEDFALASEPVGNDESPGGQRPYAIEVDTSISGGALVARWRYSESLHERRTIQALVDRYVDEVRTISELGQGLDGSVHTPSDFPLARVGQAQLDDLLSRL